MPRRDAANWMLSEALTALARAEHLHRRLFGLAAGSRTAAWEPPADIYETETGLLIFIALPGVAPEAAEVRLEGSDLVIRGRRALPPEARRAVIHRMELPQGAFERHIPMPPGHYQLEREVREGCLVLRLTKRDFGEEP